jgi:hypothetical protein
MSEQERIMNVALLWGGCFCLTAAFCLSMGNDYNREKRNWLLWMELSAAALLCCDAAAWFVQGTPGDASHLIMVATNFVVYAGLYLVLFLFNHYVGCYHDEVACFPRRALHEPGGRIAAQQRSRRKLHPDQPVAFFPVVVISHGQAERRRQAETAAPQQGNVHDPLLFTHPHFLHACPFSGSSPLKYITGPRKRIWFSHKFDA